MLHNMAVIHGVEYIASYCDVQLPCEHALVKYIGQSVSCIDAWTVTAGFREFWGDMTCIVGTKKKKTW